MAEAGNFSRLAHMREQVYYAETTAQLARARQAATADRERLTRLMGPFGDDLGFKLPERLPELPADRRAARDEELSHRRAVTHDNRLAIGDERETLLGDDDRAARERVDCRRATLRLDTERARAALVTRTAPDEAAVHDRAVRVVERPEGEAGADRRPDGRRPGKALLGLRRGGGGGGSGVARQGGADARAET